LVEESRINHATYSNSFFDSSWGASSLTSGDSVLSPESTANAVKVIASASDALHFFSKNATGISTATYSFSIYAKKGELTKFALREGSATGSYAAFDLESGTVLDGSGIISEAGNGFYRCTLTVLIPATTFGMRIYILPNSYTSGSVTNTWIGDASGGLYLYGAQLEAGSFPTSYIPTSGSTATRAADVASIPVSEFGYNQSEGSAVWEGKFLSTVAKTEYLYNFNDATTGTDVINSIRSFKFTDGNLLHRVTTDNVSQVGSDSGSVSAELFKSGFALKENSQIASTNGVNTAEDTSVLVPNITTLHIAPNFSGHIKSIKYYPRRLTNAQLQELTS